MSLLKTRVSGAWVDSDTVGASRVSGSWFPFGPDEEEPTYEAIDWVSTPAQTNLDDGPTAAYHMGCAFTVVESKPCVGLQWRVPDTLITPAVGYWATLYSLSPTIQLQKQEFVPVAGGMQEIMWEIPNSLSPSLVYVVGVTTVKYTFRSASSVGGFPFESPSGNVIASTGKLLDPADPDSPPSSNFESIYYVSPLVEV